MTSPSGHATIADRKVTASVVVAAAAAEVFALLAKARWRYELEPVDGGTRITETFDFGAAPMARGMELVGFPKGNARSIRDTLRRLQEIFGAPVS